MTRTAKNLAGVLVTIGLAGTGQPAAAEPAKPLTIGVSVIDDARTPNHTLVRAMKEATDVYRHAGLQIIWMKASSPSSDPADTISSQALNAADLRLSIHITDGARVVWLTPSSDSADRASSQALIVGIAIGTPDNM